MLPPTLKRWAIFGMSLRDKTTRYKSSRVEEQRGAAFQKIGTYLGLRLVGTISPTYG
jgi:hypothetical protein